MKKWIVLVISLMVTGTGSAYDEPGDGVPSFLKEYWEIGPEIFSHTYEEFSGGKTLMKETGTFYGMVLNAYKHEWVRSSPEEPVESAKWMKGFEGEFAYGDVDYDGQLQNGTPYKMSGLEDWLIDVRGLSGPDYPKENRLYTLYFGLGYRYLRDDSSSDPAGYLRQSNYVYLPIGLKVLSYKTQGWSLGGGVESDILLYGRQISTIGGQNYNNEQFSGYGFRANINMERQGDETAFKIQPFVRYWHIDKSDPDQSGSTIEPENETIQYGLRLFLRF